MFNILKRKKEVVLDCFTSNGVAHDLFPISPARKFIPKWWKDLEKNPGSPNNFVDFTPSANMRGCAGIIEYFQKGFIIPLWSDVIIKTTDDDYSFQFADENSLIAHHPPISHNYTFSIYHHLKFNSPWQVACDKEIYFQFSSPFWNTGTDYNFTNNFHIVPGVTSFNHIRATNVNAFMTRTENRFHLKAGMPLVYLYPNSDKKIKIKTHLVDKIELEKLAKRTIFSFNFNYSKMIKIKRDQE